MKPRYLLFPALIFLLFAQCTRYKVTYSIPPDYPEARRKQIIEIFEKGEKLYKINCSECHGIFTKGKDKVPDFSVVQIDNYSARFLGGDPKNHGVAKKMSAEQMNQVLTFLRYKKKNPKASQKPAIAPATDTARSGGL